MIQESPKIKGISKSRQGHPRLLATKATQPRTRRMVKAEPTKPLPPAKVGRGRIRYY